jgi:hypothetical protein
MPTIQKRTLTYVPGANGRGKITQTVIDGIGTPPNVNFTTNAPVTSTIVDNVAPVSGVPIFRYSKYDPNQAPVMQQLSQPISAADMQIIVQVETALEFFPVNSADASTVRVRMDNKITVRTADPTDPTRSPKCI